MKLVSGKSGGIDWARRKPPQPQAWEAAICELAEAGDQRFVKLLAGHVSAGRIVSDRARKAMEIGEAAE